MESILKKTRQLEEMYPVRCSEGHLVAPIPQESRYDHVKDVYEISGFSHSTGTCTSAQGGVKLTVNVKNGIIQECLMETVGCSGMTHSACMAVEILPGKTLQEALNTNLVCDAMHVAMREMFLNLAFGRSQSAFTIGGLPIGSGFDDLGPTIRSMVGTVYGTLEKGPRYFEMAEGYVLKLALDSNDEIIGYSYVNLGRMMNAIRKGANPDQAYEEACGTYGRYDEAVKYIDPREE